MNACTYALHKRNIVINGYSGRILFRVHAFFRKTDNLLIDLCSDIRMDADEKEVNSSAPSHSHTSIWIIVSVICVSIILAAIVISLRDCPKCQEPVDCETQMQPCEPETVTVLKYQCSDGSISASISECPIIETLEEKNLEDEFDISMEILNSGDAQSYINDPEIRIENHGKLVSNLQFDLSLYKDNILLYNYERVVFRSGSLYIDSLGPNQVRRAILDITIPDNDNPRLSQGEYTMIVEVLQGDDKNLVASDEFMVLIRS